MFSLLLKDLISDFYFITVFNLPINFYTDNVLFLSISVPVKRRKVCVGIGGHVMEGFEKFSDMVGVDVKR